MKTIECAIGYIEVTDQGEFIYHLEMHGYPKEMWRNKAFVSALAFYILTICDWQDLSTFLYELTYSDDIEDMYYGRGFFKL